MYTSRTGVNPSDLSHLRSRSRSRTPSNSNPPSPSPDSPMIPHSPLLHSASASSAAGESSFIAAAPPKPDDSTRSQPDRWSSHARSRSIFDDELSPPERPPRSLAPANSPRLALGIPNVLRRRKRLAIAFLSTLLLLSILRRLFAPTLLLAKFKLVDYAYSEVRGFPLAQRQCGFRKEPLLFVKGDDQVSIVWEIGKCLSGKDDWKLRWRREGTETDPEWTTVDRLAKSELQLDYDGGSLRSVYSTTLDNLEGGHMYRYEILHSHRPVRAYSFPFLGPARNASSGRPQTLHIGCVADNQFNLRTFHSILSRMISVARSLSSRCTPPQFPKRRPHLVLHAGDNVQNPHDLEQWQTDFWDPITKELSYNLGSQVPLALARGNHDWDKTGRNVYVGGLPGRKGYHSSDLGDARLGHERDVEQNKGVKGSALAEGKRGTFYAFSPHRRVRIIVLDSNLITLAEQTLQEDWLKWEVAKEEWTRASLRICVVHTAPWIEWWNRRAWTDGRESLWSLFVRQRLTPILVDAKTTLVLSGHSHSYSRGFVPYSIARSFTSERDSKSLAAFAAASVRERSWEKRAGPRSTGVIEEPGLVTIVYGGAGGTLDTERVEDWGLFERGKWGPDGKYHFGILSLHLAGDDGEQPRRTFLATTDRERGKSRRRNWQGDGEWVYRAESLESDNLCRDRGSRVVEDWLEWTAIDVDGGTRDRIGIVGKACA